MNKSRKLRTLRKILLLPMAVLLAGAAVSAVISFRSGEPAVLWAAIGCAIGLGILIAVRSSLADRLHMESFREPEEEDAGPGFMEEIIPTRSRRKRAPSFGAFTAGKAHGMGKRDYQQDCLGLTPVLEGQGLLAVVADGMGGLSGGEKVSQRILVKALDFGAKLTAERVDNALPEMVAEINEDVNAMLGADGIYKSGSTLIAALLLNDRMKWVSVGDSRIYLYRQGYLNQLTRDHDLLQEWMPDILDDVLTYPEAIENPEHRKLTSFIGMGTLRYMDQNLTPTRLLPGDRVLLMSDGVYGTVSEQEIAAILKEFPDVQQASDAIARQIESANLSYQDNYTVLIVGI